MLDFYGICNKNEIKSSCLQCNPAICLGDDVILPLRCRLCQSIKVGIELSCEDITVIFV